MGTLTRRTWRASLSGLLSLLVISLALPHPYTARAIAAACADGFALWANNTTRSNVLVITGSTQRITGELRSNADIRISGSNSIITGTVTYATAFADAGDANIYATPTREAATTPPFSYSIADYSPTGAIAQAALQAGRYTVVNGDLDVAEPTTLSGLYYVTGNAKLSASTIRGTFTIVAAGAIDISGSGIVASPYADGLLLFANKSEPGGAVLKLAGSNSTLSGVIYAPRGMAELSGGNNSITGAVLGDTLSLNGSSLRVTFAAEHCPGGGTPPVDDGQYVRGEVIVKLRSAADLPTVARDYGLNPQAIDQFGSRPIYQLAIIGDISPVTKAAELTAGDSRIEYAEPNYLAQDPESRGGRGSWVVGESAGGYAEQWAPATIRLPQAHTISRGAGVTVAVLDTGVDLDHPALAARLVPGFDFVDFDGIPDEVGAQGTDQGFGHGTHVAGLVALAAPQAKIMPVRVLDRAGVGNIWVLSEGLIFAAELGRDGVPGSGDEADVINLSLGTLRPTRLLEDLVAEVTCAPADRDGDGDDDDDDEESPACRSSRGVIVIAAAGNGGDTTPQYPAAEAVAGSLAVGASTRTDTRATFSTYGSWVRLAAPGENIISTAPGGNNYGTWSGTSMAAPLAAGVAALVRAVEPGLSPQAVVERLVTTARPIAGAIPRRLDAAAALGLPPSAPTTNNHDVYLPMVARGGAPAAQPQPQPQPPPRGDDD